MVFMFLDKGWAGLDKGWIGKQKQRYYHMT